MKQTPFYELAVALKDRPRSFQRIVIGSLIFCSIVLLESAVALLQKEGAPETAVAVKHQKTQTHPVLASSHLALPGK